MASPRSPCVVSVLCPQPCATASVLPASAAPETMCAPHRQSDTDYADTSDIWNLRTWGWATLAHWSAADKRHFLQARLCAPCRRRGLQILFFTSVCASAQITLIQANHPSVTFWRAACTCRSLCSCHLASLSLVLIY